MNVNITKMDASHIDRVLYIEEQCFPIPWTKEDFKREIFVNNLAHYFVAEFEDKIIGYAGMWHIVTEGHITNIAVLHDYRRMGVGQMLLSKQIEFAKQMQMIGITLEVRISNEAAQKLYTRNGFKPEGFRKRYYTDTGEDAVIMWLYF